jgi:hypothetical protein
LYVRLFIYNIYLKVYIILTITQVSSHLITQAQIIRHLDSYVCIHVFLNHVSLYVYIVLVLRLILRSAFLMASAPNKDVPPPIGSTFYLLGGVDELTCFV